MKKDILNSPRISEFKKRRRRIIFRKAFIFVFVFTLIIASLAFLSRLDKLQINSIDIVGNTVTDDEEIRRVAQKEMSGHYLYLFPKTNIFFFSRGKIENALAENLKGLTDIKLNVKNREILEISVSERLPKYIWCGQNPPEPEAENPICYFLDETGFIFDQAPYFSGEVYFKFYGLFEEKIPIGSYFLREDFARLMYLKESLERIELDPIALSAPEEGEMRMLLSPFSNNSTQPVIIFNLDADFDRMIENLQTALTTEPLQADFENKYSSLQYIDLRYGNKVYYKFR